MKRSSAFLSITLAVLLALFVAASASAQTEPWNQEKVTALSSELEKAVSGLRDSIRQSPNFQAPGQAKALNRIMRKLRSIESETLSLHAKLAKGATMEDTRLSYERIQRLRRDTQVEAKKVDVSAFVQPKLDKAKGLLDQLAPFYPAQPAKEPGPPEEEPKP